MIRSRIVRTKRVHWTFPKDSIGTPRRRSMRVLECIASRAPAKPCSTGRSRRLCRRGGQARSVWWPEARFARPRRTPRATGYRRRNPLLDESFLVVTLPPLGVVDRQMASLAPTEAPVQREVVMIINRYDPFALLRHQLFHHHFAQPLVEGEEIRAPADTWSPLVD